MNVSIIGTGYVGLVTGTCFAELGHNVTCLDIDEKKIERLKKGECPIYEIGLQELIHKNAKDKRLHFTTNYPDIQNSQVIFLALGTPATPSGEANLEFLYSALSSLAPLLQKDTIITVKSTVPIGTTIKLKEFLQEKTKTPFHMVMNPEFLKEGTAVNDFLKPDRVVVGVENDFSQKIMKELYAPLTNQGHPLLTMSITSAEMTKYASNAFLATKISFINEMAKLAEQVGGNIEEVRHGMTLDHRIGRHFLYPGVGFGGSCFPKDIKALVHTAKKLDLPLEIVNATMQVNDKQKEFMFQKISHFFKGDLKEKSLAIWGAAFKPETDDVREAPSLYLATKFLKEGAKLHFFDPIAKENFLQDMQNLVTEEEMKNITFYTDKYQALQNQEALIILTEWSEFKSPDFNIIKKSLKSSQIFDGRNLFSPTQLQKIGIDYSGIGI